MLELARRSVVTAEEALGAILSWLRSLGGSGARAQDAELDRIVALMRGAVSALTEAGEALDMAAKETQRGLTASRVSVDEAVASASLKNGVVSAAGASGPSAIDGFYRVDNIPVTGELIRASVTIPAPSGVMTGRSNYFRVQQNQTQNIDSLILSNKPLPTCHRRSRSALLRRHNLASTLGVGRWRAEPEPCHDLLDTDCTARPRTILDRYAQ
jgi:hypothetical protein